MSRGLLNVGPSVLPKLILGLLLLIVVSLVVRVQYNETTELRREVEQLGMLSRRLELRFVAARSRLPSTVSPPPHSSTTVPVEATHSALHRTSPTVPTAALHPSAMDAELHEAALQHLYYTRGEGKLFRTRFESRGRSRCVLLTCNERGLGVRIPNITEGCECVCTGGWSGAACQVPPLGSAASAVDPPLDDVVAPRVTIPLEREDVPAPPAHAKSDLEACRVAAERYFAEHAPKGEFRSDRAVDHLWKIASELVPPYCSTDQERVAIVDIGAHVGTRLPQWVELVLARGREHRCTPGESIVDDSVVLLVEPNPLNLLSLRRQVLHVASPEVDNKTAMERVNRTATASSVPMHQLHHLHGSVVMAEVAAAHYDGEGVLVVDLSANRNKKENGNERGYLRPPQPNRLENSSASTSPRRGTPSTAVLRHIRTRVRTVASLIKDSDVIGATNSARPITAISVLKIDAEGLDPLVLYGAYEMLPMTRVVVFECHKLWRERGMSTGAGGADENEGWWRLKEVVEYLAKLGFDTFLVGQFFWIPMTAPHYWADVYEEKLEWSNCVALRKGHPMTKAFSLPPPCSATGGI
jgi:hypothetical protein